MSSRSSPAKAAAKRLPCRIASMKFLALLLLSSFMTLILLHKLSHGRSDRLLLDPRIRALTNKCRLAHTPAGPPPFYDPYTRITHGSDRYERGTPAVLIRNARILTGARNGTEIIFGDILLDKGLVAGVGYIPSVRIRVLEQTEQLIIVDAKEKWVSPGLVDLHSHLGVYSAPELNGAADMNSFKGPILPWLRSIDGLNTHDDAYALVVAGGVTSTQILPGSANSIGGQAVVIKLRSPPDRSVSSYIIEPPPGFFINVTTDYIPWRHMKHACGENPSAIYSQTRMDSAWSLRNAYNEALKIKEAQDSFCATVDDAVKGLLPLKAMDDFIFTNKDVTIKGEFPEDLKWEAFVDVLRGKVKLSVHCYEAVDLDMIVRLSNEFKFPVASLHHAAEAYLVPDLLRKAWGGPPSVALFASHARKKREAYRGSGFAASVLAGHGIPVVMKSDHPVINARYLLYEAQQAHFYGLHQALSIASVTSTPARAAGLGHRIGTLAPGYDADVVLWDSHPLALGATPEQVWIDGIPQLKSPALVAKPKRFQEVPKVPNFDKERKKTVDWDGLPPLRGSQQLSGTVNVVGVRNFWKRGSDGQIKSWFPSSSDGQNLTVIVRNGQVICPVEDCTSTCSSADDEEPTRVIDLEGGSIAPGLTSFGSPLGLSEIGSEPSTNDGVISDPLLVSPPTILGDTLIRAVDGLQLNGRNLLLAYRAGVTRCITAPLGSGFFLGIGTAFRAGAMSTLEKTSILLRETAVHISISLNSQPSVSTQIGLLRSLLFANSTTDEHWAKVRQGKLPLVIHVQSADIMASLITLKSEYESKTDTKLRITFVEASEAHLVAEEIAKAGISVVLLPVRPYPETWESRRILPGPPLTRETSLSVLLAHGVNVGLGSVKEFDAKNARFDMAWVVLESGGKIDYAKAFALYTTNLEKALGMTVSSQDDELVLYSGGSVFGFESKVIGVISGSQKAVELF